MCLWQGVPREPLLRGKLLGHLTWVGESSGLPVSINSSGSVETAPSCSYSGHGPALSQGSRGWESCCRKAETAGVSWGGGCPTTDGFPLV